MRGLCGTILVTFILSLAATTAPAQRAEETQLTRILFVFDASNSMNANWQSDKRITIAKRLLSQAVAEVNDKPNVEMALRVYGHQVAIAPGKQDCEDTRLEVSFRPGNGALIKSTLDRLSAKGTTPIARSLEKAAGDFPPCNNCRNVIILITDGIEACDGDPCAVSRALQKQGIIVKPFIIGVGLDDEYKNQFHCVGNYFDAVNEESFRHILDIVITQALNNTTAQVNLLDDYGRPLETNVTVNFFSQHQSALEYAIVHTLNHRGNPDTLTLDPTITYRIEVHTIPPIVKEGVTLVPAKHNVIPIDAGQGRLDVRMGGRMGQDVPLLVRRTGEVATAHVMYVGKPEKLLTQVYDLEILTLPRTRIPNVEVTQDKTTTVTIPEPGQLNLSLPSPSYGSIALINGSNHEWVINLDESNTNQQFRLQPGRYKLTLRARNSKQVIFTVEREFQISSGAATNLKL
jgi:Ca-activated chloride channel family protein